MLALAAAALDVGLASASCVPGRSPHDTTARHAGTQGSASTLDGVSAYITQYDPYYSAFDGAGTNASVLLVKFATFTDWAQVGWLKHLSGSTVKRETFAQIWTSATQLTRYFTAQAPPNTTLYKVIYESPSTFSYYQNGSLLTQYDAAFAPGNWQAFGETHDLVDQFPGNGTNPVQLGSLTFYTGSSYTQHTANGGTFSEYSDFKVTNPNPGQYLLWDGKCA